jgi:Flp pilus assembly protein TadD
MNEYQMIKGAYEAAPDDRYYVLYLGDLLVDRLGDIYQAKEVWERAVRGEPRNARALERLGEVEAFLGNDARAVERAQALKPGYPEVESDLAMLRQALPRKR